MLRHCHIFEHFKLHGSLTFSDGRHLLNVFMFKSKAFIQRQMGFLNLVIKGQNMSSQVLLIHMQVV